MTETAWKNPVLTVHKAVDIWASGGVTAGPLIATVSVITAIDMRANMEAFASAPILRLSDSGYEIPMTNKTMTGFRWENQPKTGIERNVGKIAVKTAGIVSPIITQ